MPNANSAGAACAVAGAALLFVGTYLHPMRADPNEPAAAFSEYAEDRLWIASHLMQLAGVATAVAALLFMSDELQARTRLARGAAIVSLALAAALQAVDGIALKNAVDAWAAAPAEKKDLAFHAAFAVRQVEIGLASITSLFFGCTVTVYGVALLVDRTFPKWLGGLASAGGIATVVAGVVLAYTGFSREAMAISMPAGFLIVIWLLGLGACLWRRAQARPEHSTR